MQKYVLSELDSGQRVITERLSHVRSVQERPPRREGDPRPEVVAAAIGANVPTGDDVSQVDQLLHELDAGRLDPAGVDA